MAIAFSSDDRAERHGATSLPVIPAEQAGLPPASESRNPVIKEVRAFTPAMDYWVPARAIPVEPGSLGRDDSLPSRRLKARFWKIDAHSGPLAFTMC
jgi:hypothetical protein